MRWFKHSSDMRFDPKIRKVMRKYGADGYAIYNYILEAVAQHLTEDSPVPILEETSEDIAEILRVDSRRVEEIVQFMAELRLFGFVEESAVVCVPSVINHADEYHRKKGKTTKLRQALIEFQAGDYVQLPGPVVVPEEPVVARPDFTVDVPGAGGGVVDRMIVLWNQQADLPECKRLAVNLPNSEEVTSTIVSFGEDEIAGAIAALGRNYKRAQDTGEKVPRTFQSFIAKSVDGWVESQNPDERYLSDDERILAGLYSEVEA